MPFKESLTSYPKLQIRINGSADFKSFRLQNVQILKKPALKAGFSEHISY